MSASRYEKDAKEAISYWRAQKKSSVQKSNKTKKKHKNRHQVEDVDEDEDGDANAAGACPL